MTTKTMHKKKFNLNVESLVELPVAAHIYWKDTQGVYLGTNDLFAEKIGVYTTKDIIGKSDYDLPYLEAEVYRQADLLVLNNNKPMCFQDCSTFPDCKIDFLTIKVPLLDQEKKLAGIFGISYYQSALHIKNNLSDLVDAGGLPIACEVKKHFSMQENIYNLTKRQLDCLYYLVKGMTLKEIAQTLAISPRTVETHIIILKQKLNCAHRSDLIHKALSIDCIKAKLLETS